MPSKEHLEAYDKQLTLERKYIDRQVSDLMERATVLDKKQKEIRQNIKLMLAHEDGL